MATYAIKWLKDKLGTRFFPVTHLKAVRDDNDDNLETILADKQDELVSGVNIKTINGNSILGSGNMDVSGGGGGGQANVIESISVNGTGQAVDANKNVNLQFKTVNNNSISGTGNISISVPTKVSDLTNDAGYITGYTETDPVFSASAAANITSSDITNWNGKTSNIGTITSVKMNGTTVSSSGEADLGTVITSHQDISGKADKSATVSTVTYDTTNKKIRKTINGTTTDVVTAATIVADGGGITTETDPTVPSWAKASSKPSYTASEVGAVPTTRTVNGKALSADITLSASDVSALPSSTAIPSKTSDLTNDSGFLTSADISGVYKYKGSKTNYSNLPSTGNVTGDVWNVVNAYSTYPAGTNFAWDGTTWDALGGSVDLSGYVPTSRTINGKALSSNITLSASDVSALPSSTVIPDELSDLSDDATHRLVTDTEKSTWNSKGTYSKPSGGIPKTDLASAVQTSLGLADTALQSYTESDPVFTASAAHGISSTDISNWNAKGTYSKPSGGIPKTDLASAVQTSLGKADTALQSYTETDPVFAASAAADITSSDISNWNSKTSNIGTITGITMNGASKGTSGVVDLGTVITAHQDISGKADKSTTTTAGTYKSVTVNSSGIVTGGSNPTTLAGYGITDAYTKTEIDSNFYALDGGTNLNPSSSNTVDLNLLDAPNSYYISSTSGITYISNLPINQNSTFRIWVSATGSDGYSRRQRLQFTQTNEVWERYSTAYVSQSGGSHYDWSDWKCVQGNLGDYLPLSGGTMTGLINFDSSACKIGITNTEKTNIDIGWDWDAYAGSGIAFRSASHSSYAGSFRLYARTSSSSSHMLEGRATGELLWSGNRILDASNTYVSSDKGYINGTEITTISGNAATATTLATSRTIWGQSFDGSSYVRGTLSMFPDSLGMNNDTAKLWFRANTSASGDGYSPYIQGIYQATTGRKRLSVFQINNANYTGTHSEVFTILPNGRVGVGTVEPNTLLHVNGVVTCTSVTQTSDESKKEKIDDINISVEKIAQAPNITFKWKEGEDKELHGGTIAQYWEDVAPYYVHGDECKTLEYSNLAMSCSIEVAKEVVKLKEENAQLKKELAEIKDIINKLTK